MLNACFNNIIMAYFRFPPLQRGGRGDLGALENPPKSPFFKGGLESIFAWSPANGRLSPVQLPYSSTSIPEPFTLDTAVSSVGEAQSLAGGGNGFMDGH